MTSNDKMFSNSSSLSTTTPPPTGEGAISLPLSLNFHNHCLLCLQHVDPLVIKAINEENPKGLHNFQPILQFLTGTVDTSLSSGSGQKKYYPVTRNLPPLCTVCYDILAELHMFHGELMALQRKIQNQTEAARRIAMGTTRRGGMRAEFFKRLQIAEAPPEEIEAMEYFVGNFHGLISQADRKAVLPQLLPLTFNDFSSRTSSSPEKAESSLKPYSVQFAEPSLPNPNSQLHLTVTDENDLAQMYFDPQSAIFVRIPTAPAPAPARPAPTATDPVICQEDDDDDDIVVLSESPPPTNDLNQDQTPGKPQEPQDPLSDGVYLVTGQNVEYEYEGDEEEGGVGGGLGLEEEEDDDVMVLDDDHEERGGAADAEVQEKEGEEPMGVEDVNYWRNVLSSQVTIEEAEGKEDEEDYLEETVQVQEDPPGPPRRRIQRNIELIELDDDEEEVMEGDEDNIEYAYEDQEDNLQQMSPPPLLNPNSSGQPVILSVVGSGSASSSSSNVSGGGGGDKNKAPYNCRTCGKEYSELKKFKYHELGHLPGGRPRPFICRYCDRAFTTKTLMDQHARTHTGERPYTCDTCGSSFRQGSTLYRHKQTHTKEGRRKTGGPRTRASR